jgi:hypothetical protein
VIISPNTVSCDISGRDKYEVREEEIYQKLYYIAISKRIALITNGWASNNKLNYIAVIKHIIYKADSKMESMLLNIIELMNLIHNSLYLA